MFMIIIHIAYITCLVTNDAWHAYDVIGVYKIHHRTGEISYFVKQTIMRLASRVMGDVVGHNQVVGACPSGQVAKTIGQKIYCID